MKQEDKEQILLTIPTITNDKLKLFVDDVFIGELDVNQVNEYRVNIVTYITQTGDKSITDRFYFVGHEDTDDVMRDEIKITMNARGDFSHMPYEVSHVRRDMRKLMQIEIERINKVQNDIRRKKFGDFNNDSNNYQR